MAIRRHHIAQIVMMLATATAGIMVTAARPVPLSPATTTAHIPTTKTAVYAVVSTRSITKPLPNLSKPLMTVYPTFRTLV
ncbi:MAG: hypothetical protein M1600_01710, partial [Firmicutes bacterium]|nr:hypothetical protein [Bacillota bacterium]